MSMIGSPSEISSSRNTESVVCSEIPGYDRHARLNLQQQDLVRVRLKDATLTVRAALASGRRRGMPSEVGRVVEHRVGRGKDASGTWIFVSIEARWLSSGLRVRGNCGSPLRLAVVRND